MEFKFIINEKNIRGILFHVALWKSLTQHIFEGKCLRQVKRIEYQRLYREGKTPVFGEINPFVLWHKQMRN